MKRRTILLPGMHRSGTSATARVLNLLGCEIPGPLVPAFHGNDFGHWEPQAVVDLHDSFLKAAQVNVNSVFGLEPAWFSSAEAQRQVDAAVDLLERHLSDAPLHVIKDPRMGFFIPIWRQALDHLGVEAAFVLPFRDPAEVAASLTRRQTYVYPDAVWPPGRGVLLWLRYVLTAERATRDMPRAFLAYDALLADWSTEVQRIGDQLHVAWPQSDTVIAPEINRFLSRELKHEKIARRKEFPLAYEVFDQLSACIRDPVAGEEVFARAFDEINRASDLFEPYVAELELRLGANPTLRIEFVDFLRRTAMNYDGRTDRGDGDGEPGCGESISAESSESLLIGLQAERRTLIEQKAELEAFNTGLLGAARYVEASHIVELREALASREQAEHEARRASASVSEALTARELAERKADEMSASLAEAREAASIAEARMAALVAEAELARHSEVAQRERVQAELNGLTEALGQADEILLARSAELDAVKQNFNSRWFSPWVGRVFKRASKRWSGTRRGLDGRSP